MNMLQELYYGNLRPIAKCYDPTSRYAELLKTASKNEKLLFEYLAGDADAKLLLTNFTEAQDETQRFGEKEAFMEGFRMGARLMLDLFVFPGESVIRDIARA